jgi:hypothetical protein
MPYTADITRANPACFVILVDQSGSMSDPLGGAQNRRKADAVADAINHILQDLGLRASKNGKIRDYFYVSVIGYGKEVRPAFAGALGSSSLVGIGTIASTPLRLDQREVETAGDKRLVSYPIWFEPVADGPTPMCAALNNAADLCSAWIASSPNGFPPIVLNVTDGQSTDGDPVAAAARLCSLKNSDGNVLLFNLHLSELNVPAILYPTSERGLPDDFARLLYRMSSLLPPSIVKTAKDLDVPCTTGSRGFIFNADFGALSQFLVVGTMPAGFAQLR